MPVATHLAIVFVVAGPVPAPDGVQVTVPVPVPATATVTVSAISKVAHRPAGTVIMLEFVAVARSEEHTSELQSRLHLVCRLLLAKNTLKSWLRGGPTARNIACNGFSTLLSR